MKKTGDLRFAVQVMFLIFVMELIGFLISNSLALLSDSFLILVEFLFFAMVLKGMKSGKLNSVVVIFSLIIFMLSLSIIYFSVYRFVFGSEVMGMEMLVFAGAGLFMNSFVMRKVRKRFKFKAKRFKRSFEYVLRKTIPSMLLIAGGIWILFTGEVFIDFTFAFVISLIAMFESILLFRDSAVMLLGVPKSKTYLFKTVL